MIEVTRDDLSEAMFMKGKKEGRVELAKELLEDINDRLEALKRADEFFKGNEYGKVAYELSQIKEKLESETKK